LKRRRYTAGEMSLKASQDSATYNGVEVAEATFAGLHGELLKNAHDHIAKIDEPEFFVVWIRAGDPLLYNARRYKIYSYPYLPSPRPEQAVFLYIKAKDSLTFVWSLPPARVMAAISEATVVQKKWARTKGWCDAFFDGKLWELARKQQQFNHLSEIEYLKANREKLIKAGCKEGPPLEPEAFDFTKITTDQVVHSQPPVL
jgi:hypothetical protein